MMSMIRHAFEFAATIVDETQAMCVDVYKGLGSEGRLAIGIAVVASLVIIRIVRVR